MPILKEIKDAYLAKKRKKIINILRTISPDVLIRASEKNLITAFQRAAARVPAYKKLLCSLNINPADITDIGSFKKSVPFLDKRNTFAENEITNLCLDGNLKEVKSLLTSSGHSGIFSFGVNTFRNLKDSSESIDLGLDYSFDITNRKTLLINCLPMGVKVNTSLTVAETSVREDMVWAVIKKFSGLYDQTILVGEGSFLKKIIEEGAAHGIDWKSGTFHIVAGEEGIAENYRTYLAGLLGVDFENPQKGMIGSSMGIAELDLNIFHETRDTIKIRRLAHIDADLRHALFGEDAKICPMLFVYYPHRTYIEELSSEYAGHHQIMISMLSPRMKIPLIRYITGDTGRLLPYNMVRDILRRLGYEKLLPELKLPLIAIYGRGRCAKFKNAGMYPEEVKEVIYSDFSIASSVTGAFKLTGTSSGIHIAMQLKRGVTPSDALDNRFRETLLAFTDAPISIDFYPYAAFPHFMELDYERKFNYV
jgi:phenylacetate-CoA ligase